MEESTIEKRISGKCHILNKYADVAAIITVLAMLPFAIAAADRLLAL